MYLSTVFYRKKDLYTISDIEIFIFYLNLMTLADSGSFKLQNRNTFSLNSFQIAENHSVFVFGQVIYKNTNK